MEDDDACSLFLLGCNVLILEEEERTHTKRTYNWILFRNVHFFNFEKKTRESHSTHVVYPTLAYIHLAIERYSAKKKYTVYKHAGETHV